MRPLPRKRPQFIVAIVIVDTSARNRLPKPLSRDDHRDGEVTIMVSPACDRHTERP
jgi:hypothetical protein